MVEHRNTHGRSINFSSVQQPLGFFAPDFFAGDSFAVDRSSVYLLDPVLR